MTKTYRENRAVFSVQELGPYAGKWIAFSADGRRIVASGRGIADLSRRVQAAGEDLHNVVIERIELDDAEVFMGGAELL